MPKIITVSGHAENGKDLTATILKEKFELKGYKVLIIHYADLVKFISQKYFGWDGKKDNKGRSLLQWLGTDIVRKRKPNYWVDFVKGFVELFDNEFDYVLIPDARFLNELEIWKKEGFKLISLHVERLDFENSLTPQQRLHPSETALDDYKFDYYIKSVSGTEYLTIAVEKFIKYIEGEE